MGKFTNYHHTKFHMPDSNSSLVITNKLKAKRIIGMTTMLLCSLQKIITLMQITRCAKTY